MSDCCIILANFGTTQLKGINSILNIKKIVEKSFPKIPVMLTFTSNIIRKIWKKRNIEKDVWIKKGVPEEILNVKGIVATIGEAIEKEFKKIIVQPTHIFYMEQVHDLYSYIKAFQSIKTMQKKWMPFEKIVMGRPALGMFSERYDYINDIKIALNTLKKDVEYAKKNNSDLLYMAHGNEKFPLGIFYEIEKIYNEMYPEINTFFACVEGNPSFDEFLKKSKNRKVILKPFMIVAGTHAEEDMSNWCEKLLELNYNAEMIKEGLGDNDEFAKIFVNHIKDVAKDYDIF